MRGPKASPLRSDPRRRKCLVQNLDAGTTSRHRTPLSRHRSASPSNDLALPTICNDTEYTIMLKRARDGKNATAPLASALFFSADAWDNGEGYAVELGRTRVFANILNQTARNSTAAWEDPRHAHYATVSCPDWLRVL